MKQNVIIVKAYQIQEDLFFDKPSIESCKIEENGDFVYRYVDGKGYRMTANEIAEGYNMPLWEVVMVDYLGNDEYALMMFEE